jgi:chorismate mutase
MTSDSPTLSDLRREIDQIDEALHDLLMKRAAVVDGVRAAKRQDGGGAFRPAREAQVLRGLVRRHHGSLPRGLVVRQWGGFM